MQNNHGLQMAAVAIILILITAGCATNTSKGTSGTVIGAAAGAIAGQAIGRDTKGTLIGAAVGGLLGYIVGNEMDKYDQAQLNQIYENSPSNQRSQWVNPDTNRSYAVTPRPAYTQPSGQVCREAEILATVDGRPEKVVSLACRDNNGRWVIQK
ncbi:MAG: glycine zipper domain-containing protein [Pseudomonadota bacterium]